MTKTFNLYLAKLFKVETKDPSPDLWRVHLGQFAANTGQEGKPAEKAPQTRGGTRTRKRKETTFMGISAEGQRIVYLIDMSDSMLLPLSPEEKETLRRPVTGSDRSSKKKRKKRRGQINWDRVQTRFDAVREFLKLSLRSLSSRASYAVIGFGSRAQCLGTTPRMTPAQPKNRAATIQELDGLRAGSVTAARKHGTLRGMTNLHAALRLGFQLTARDTLRSDDEHVHPLALEGGCDTIFVLSDGTPTQWDYSGRGPMRDVPGYETKAVHRKYKVKDPETGEEREVEVNQPARKVPPRKVPQSMTGPYQDTRHFRADLQRLNLFRKVTIHVVGVGEYSRTWLELVSKAGMGKLRLIGKGQAKEDKARQEAEERRQAAEKRRQEEAAKKEAAGG